MTNVTVGLSIEQIKNLLTNKLLVNIGPVDSVSLIYLINQININIKLIKNISKIGDSEPFYKVSLSQH